MGSFLYPIPRSVLVALLRSESSEEGFSDPAVRVSLFLDVDRGRIKSQRDYADIWGWSRSKVRYHWDDIRRDVIDWASSYGRQPDSPLMQRIPEAWKRALLEPSDYHPLGTQQQPTLQPKKRVTWREYLNLPPTRDPPYNPPSAHHTISSHSLHPFKECVFSRARGEPGVWIATPVEPDGAERPSEAYRRICGHRTGLTAADIIDKTVGEDPEHRALWEEVCRAWKQSPTRNQRQPFKLLQDFKKQRDHDPASTRRLTRNPSESEGAPGGDGTGGAPDGLDYDALFERDAA